MRNAYELQEWREGISKLLKTNGHADSKDGFLAYVKFNFQSLYDGVVDTLPENFSDLSWNQIATIFCPCDNS